MVPLFQFLRRYTKQTRRERVQVGFASSSPRRSTREHLLPLAHQALQLDGRDAGKP